MLVPTNILLKQILPITVHSVVAVAFSPIWITGGALFICCHSVALHGAKALPACLPSEYPADAMRP